jgi:hypothetical protein
LSDTRDEPERLEPAAGGNGAVDDEQSIPSLVLRLGDPTRGRYAARTLRRAATRWPARFLDDDVHGVLAALDLPAVADLALGIASDLAATHPRVLTRVRDAAAAFIRDGHPNDPALLTVIPAIDDGAVVVDEPLVAGIIRGLRAPDDRYPWLPNSRSSDVDPAPDAIRSAARADPDVVAAVIQTALRSDDAGESERGAAAVIELTEEPKCDAWLAEFVQMLVEALDQRRRWEVDASLALAVTRCLEHDPEGCAERIFRLLPRVRQKTAHTIVRAFAPASPGSEATPPWITWLLSAVCDRDRTLEFRLTVAETIESAVHAQWSFFLDRFDLMLMSLLDLARQHAEVLARYPSGDTVVTPNRFNELEIERLHSGKLVSVLERAVSAVARTDPATTVSGIAAMLRAKDAALTPELLASLLHVLGECGRSQPEVAAVIVPVAYTYLLHPEEWRVCAAAATALYELAHWDRDALPNDALIAVGLLLDHNRVAVLNSAVSVFTVATVANLAIARAVFRSLVTLREVLGGDPSLSSLMRIVTDAEVNVARRHPELYGDAARELDLFSAHPQRRVAEPAIMEFGRFARGHPESQDTFVRAVTSYYRRFQLLPTVQSNSLPDYDPVFAAMFHLRAEVLQANAPLLLEWCAESSSPQPARCVAALLLAIDDERASDAFELASARSEPDGAEAEVYLGLTELVRGERALLDGDLDAAAESFKVAVGFFDAADAPDARATMPQLRRWMGQRYGAWSRLRRLWVGLSLEPARLGGSVQGLRSAMERLVSPDIERDAVVERMLGALLDALSMLADWYEAVRARQPAAEHFAAAVARFHDSVRLMRALSGENGLYQTALRDLDEAATQVEGFSASSSLEPVLELVRGLALPIPLGELPVTREWRIRTSPARRARDPRAEQGSNLMATVELRINGARADSLTEVSAGETHDVEFLLELEAPPHAGDQLVVRPVSTLSAEDYRFIEVNTPVDPTQLIYRFSGRMRFDHPQAEGSHPHEVRLRAWLERAGEHRALTLIGQRSVSVRVHRGPVLAPYRCAPDATSLPTLEIPGERRRGGGQFLVANGRRVALPRQAFLRFLLLIVAAHETNGGFIGAEEFVLMGRTKSVDEEWESAELDHGASDIRQPIEATLGFASGEFIEIRERKIRARIDLAHVTWDREKLITLSGQIAELAKRLPATAPAVA